MDLVIHVRNVYRPCAAPYVPFIDCTGEMDRRGWPQWSGGRRAADWYKKRETAYYRAALHVLTAGTLAKASLVDDYGVDPSRVTVVGGGTNLKVSAKPREPQPVGRILFVGYEYRRKGGDLLVEAFAKVRQEFPSTELLFVGGDLPRRKPPGVRSMGRVRSREQLSAIYENSTVLCLPARYEPYGLVVQEAMAHGMPCVVSRTGALPDIVQDGVTGFVVPPGDVDALASSLLRILRDPQQAAAMGEAGRALATLDLTWEAVADRAVSAIGAALAAVPSTTRSAECATYDTGL